MLAWGAAGALVLAAVLLAPHLLRRSDFFRVRRVELVGVRYLAPERVLAALQIARDQNVFDPADAIERRALALPGVVAVRIQRRLPGTLRVVISERVPVAFAPGPEGLVPLDRAARPLPYDPTVTGFDLPLVPRPDTLLTRVLALVRAADSALYQHVESARRDAAGAVTLELSDGAVRLTARPTRAMLRAVAVVRRHLVARGERFATLDARFGDWVVVRRGGA